MNELTKPQATGISTDVLSKLKAGIAQSRSATALQGFGGKPLLRMLKSGEWVHGQEDVPVQDNSQWAINPLSIMHGWVAWTNHAGNAKNTMVGELMAPVFEPKPVKPPPADGWPFSEQRTFELKCLNGEDKGLEVLHKTSSIGGMRAVDDLLKALQEQLDIDPSCPCAVVTMETGSYKHAKYGQIFTPAFRVVGFVDMSGKVPGERAAAVEAPVEAPPAAAAAPGPARRRRAPAAPVEAAAAPPAAAPVEPAPTAALHSTGSPRRRPAAR
jgi:hypothetical protein